MFLALKEMKKEKVRFTMVILVTALITFLVYFLSGLAYGLSKANTTSIEYWNNKGVVLTKSANQNIYSSKIKEDYLSKIDLKNNEAINITTGVVSVNDESKRNDLVFMGLKNYESKLIAPLISGRNIENKNEIIVSDSFNKSSKIKVNDTIKLVDNGREYKIVGISEDAEYNVTPVAYADIEMVSQEMMMYYTGDASADAVAQPTPNTPRNVSAIVVKDDFSKSDLKKYDLELLDVKEFTNAIPGYQAQLLTFALMIVSLIIISSVIIGIFMYILTMQKRSIFGVLKIQGINNKYISRSVFAQTLIIIIIGVLIGLGLTLISFMFIPEVVPVKASYELYAIIALLCIVFSLIGSIFSARSILKIDPLDSL